MVVCVPTTCDSALIRHSSALQVAFAVALGDISQNQLSQLVVARMVSGIIGRSVAAEAARETWSARVDMLQERIQRMGRMEEVSPCSAPLMMSLPQPCSPFFGNFGLSVCCAHAAILTCR